MRYTAAVLATLGLVLPLLCTPARADDCKTYYWSWNLSPEEDLANAACKLRQQNRNLLVTPTVNGLAFGNPPPAASAPPPRYQDNSVNTLILTDKVVNQYYSTPPVAVVAPVYATPVARLCRPPLVWVPYMMPDSAGNMLATGYGQWVYGQGCLP